MVSLVYFIVSNITHTLYPLFLEVLILTNIYSTVEIIQERLEREFDLDLIVTAPSVVYEFIKANGEKLQIDAPSKMPDRGRDDKTLEPYVRMEILTPSEYNGPLIELGQERRGILLDINYLTPTRSTIVYELPLGEVITDFFDEVKSRSKVRYPYVFNQGQHLLWKLTTSFQKGYASMEYKLLDYRESDLVRLDIKINGEDAAPLASIQHRDNAQKIGRRLTAALKEQIPRQMFKVPIQACKYWRFGSRYLT